MWREREKEKWNSCVFIEVAFSVAKKNLGIFHAIKKHFSFRFKAEQSRCLTKFLTPEKEENFFTFSPPMNKWESMTKFCGPKLAQIYVAEHFMDVDLDNRNNLKLS